MGTGFAEMTAVDSVRLAERCFGRSDRRAQLPDAPRTRTYDVRRLIDD
jgi:hypothetical protein